MSMIPPVVNPLLGGSLSTGPTGLGGLTGAALNGARLPYAPGVGSLMSGPAAPFLPRVGASLADIATLRPITSAMGSMPADMGLAAQAGRAVSGGGMRGMLGALPIKNPGLVKGGLWGLAGSLGATGVDRLNIGGGDSVADQFLTGAAFGGLAAVPFGGPAASAVAAPVAGALNVLGNAIGLWGNDEDKPADVQPVEVIANAIQTAGLRPDVTEDILTTYDTLMALAEQQPEGDARDAAQQAAFDQTSALVLQAMQQAQQEQQTAIDGPSLLALQQQAAQIFQPLADDITQSAGLYAQAMEGIRPNLPESYQAVADASMAREMSSADKLASAYKAQAALTPVVDRLTRYQQEQDAFARQQYQQMLAQQAAGMAGGGGASDVLTALAG